MPRLPLDSTTELRSLTVADAQQFLAVVSANRGHLDRWLRWSSSITSVASAAEFIGQSLAREAAGDGFHLGIWCEGQLAGGSVCWYIQRHHRHAEVGYWLAENFVGRGLASRAAGAVLQPLFTTERLHRVEMQCAVDNQASRSVAERLGLKLEGIRRDSHWITDRFRDHAIYGILAPEWAAPHS